jgi:Subtilase family
LSSKFYLHRLLRTYGGFSTYLLAFVGFLLPASCWSQTQPCTSIGFQALSNGEANGSTNLPGKSANSIVVALDADAPPETLEYIASIAKKTTCETEGSESIGEVSGLIGQQPGAADVLIDLNPNLVSTTKSQKSAKSTLIPPHTNVILPEVVPPPGGDYAWVHVPPGGTVSELADRLGNPTGPESLRQFSAMNQQVPSLDNVPPYAAVRLPKKRTVQIVNLAEGLDAEAISRTTAAKTGVNFAFPNYEGILEHPVKIDPDTLASSGAHYKIESLKDDWFVSKVGADKLKKMDLAVKDTVIVAVLDSGLDLSHPAFKNNLWVNSSQGSYRHNNVQNDEHGYDFSSFLSKPDDTLKDSHGTHVAGIASARYLGTLVTALEAPGLDSKLKLMILRVADNGEHVGLGAVTLATDYAGFNGARVVSASWTMRDYPGLSEIILKNPRTLFIVAAGNGEDDGTERKKGANIDDSDSEVYPASYRLPNVITVGASDPDGNIAYFSNWGPKTVGLLAPGVKIKSTVEHVGDDYALGYISGTSQAAPFVTLAAALILTTDNTLPVDSVKKRILCTADVDEQVLKYAHYGRLNLLKAVAINEDLIETKDHAIYRGTIMNTLLHFADESEECTKAEKLVIAREKIFRLVVDFNQSASELFRGTHMTLGRLCDATLTIKTETGNVNVSSAEMHDVIWHGIPQFDLHD